MWTVAETPAGVQKWSEFAEVGTVAVAVAGVFGAVVGVFEGVAGGLFAFVDLKGVRCCLMIVEQTGLVATEVLEELGAHEQELGFLEIEGNSCNR